MPVTMARADSLGRERADRFAGSPHFGVADGGQFFAQLLLVIGFAAGGQDALAFLAALDALVEFLEDGQDGLFETRFPVQGAALGGGGAVGVHPVHAVFIDQADEALGEFLDGFVEGLAGAVAVGAEDLVLGLHDAGQGAHEDAAFPGQVAEDLVLEGGGEQVSGADADADGQAAFFGPSGGVLANGKAGVDAGAGQEIAAHGGAGAFGGHHDDVHVFGRHDMGVFLVGD